MFNITAMRMTSGLVLKYLNEAGLVMGKSYATALPHSSKVLLTSPASEHNGKDSKERAARTVCAKGTGKGGALANQLHPPVRTDRT